VAQPEEVKVKLRTFLMSAPD